MSLFFLDDKKKSIIVMSDTMMNGNAINPNKWTTVDVSDTVTIAAINGIGLQFTGTHAANSVNFNNYLKSIKNVKNGIIAVQSNMIWTPNVINTEAVGNFLLWFDNNNYVDIRSRGSDVGGGTFRLNITQAGLTVYTNSTTGISNGKDIKITYNFTNNNIKFWYYSNGWNQMGTTQTFNIDNGQAAHILLNYVDILSAVGNDTTTFKNVFLTSQDYLTNFPK